MALFAEMIVCAALCHSRRGDSKERKLVWLALRNITADREHNSLLARSYFRHRWHKYASDAGRDAHRCVRDMFAYDLSSPYTMANG